MNALNWFDVLCMNLGRTVLGAAFVFAWWGLVAVGVWFWTERKK